MIVSSPKSYQYKRSRSGIGVNRDKALRSVSSLYQYKRGVGTGGCVKSAVSIQAIKEVRSRSEDEVLRVSSLYQYERMVVNVEMSESVRCINTSEW